MIGEMTDSLVIRPAVPEDVNHIHDLLEIFAKERLLLPRTHLDLLVRINNFLIAEVDGVFAGCSALRDYGSSLYEVRSLAVAAEFQNRGIASALVEKQILKLRQMNEPVRLFALTYRVGFFLRMGFHLVERDLFPEKIWSDCERCPKNTHCDETAVLMQIN